MTQTRMLRRVLLALVGCAACSEDPASGPSGNSHVAYYDLPGTFPTSMDVLVVLDDTTAMAAYADEVATLPASIAAVVDDPYGLPPDVRIAVTTTSGDGALRPPASTSASQPYLAISYDPRLARHPNFTGNLIDRLEPLLDVGAARTGTVAPLEATRLALTTHPGVWRDDALRVIVTIAASDDASSSPVDDYVAAVTAQTTEPMRTIVSGIYPANAPRLTAFHAGFPNRASSVDIATKNFAEPLGQAGYYLTPVLGAPCVSIPADVDPETPGDQYSCDLHMDFADGTQERIDACRASFDGPCFELLPMPGICVDPSTTWMTIRGFSTLHRPTIRGQCVVDGP